MSAIALLYMVSSPLLAKRYSEKVRYYTWLIILIGFIIPMRPGWGVSLINVKVPSSIPVVSSQSPFNNTVLSEPSFTLSLWQIVFLVWLAGLIIFLAYHGIKHYRFIKITQRWSVKVTDEIILSVFQNLKSEMKIKRQFPIYLCTFINSPMMMGLLKPRILLPTENYSQDEIMLIPKHELIHYKRLDILYKYLVLIVTAMHWFNPTVYFIAKHIHNLCESSCDAEMLQNADMETRQAYGKTMLAVMQNKSVLNTSLSTCFSESKNNVGKRMLSIMDTTVKKAGRSIVFAALFLVIITGLIVSSTPADEEKLPDINQILEAGLVTNKEICPDAIIYYVGDGFGMTVELATIIKSGLATRAGGAIIITMVDNDAVFTNGMLTICPVNPEG